jgi:hypothetical protein
MNVMEHSLRMAHVRLPTQASDVGSIPIARSIDDSVAFMLTRLSR